MRIVIIGAGIGGLATALSLHAAGFRDVTVYERVQRAAAARRRHQPAAARGARADRARPRRRGRRDRRRAVTPRVLQPLRPADLERAARPRGRLPLAAALGAPRRVPAAARRRRATSGSATTRSDSAIASIRVEHGGRDAGSRGSRCRGRRASVDADVVIGRRRHPLRPARASATPTRARRRGTASSLWRGTARVPAYLDGRTMIMAGDGEQKFVAYPLVRAGCRGPGPRQLHRRAARAEGIDETVDWNRAVDPGAHRRALRRLALRLARRAGASSPRPTRSSSTRWSTATRSPHWTVRPHDAARRRRARDVPERLERRVAGDHRRAHARRSTWRRRRRSTTRSPRTRPTGDPPPPRLLGMTRQLGPERVMQLAYERAPDGFADIHDVIPARRARRDRRRLQARRRLPPRRAQRARIADSAGA